MVIEAIYPTMPKVTAACLTWGFRCQIFAWSGFFAGPNKQQQWCSVSRFSAFLGKAESVTKALEPYLDGTVDSSIATTTNNKSLATAAAATNNTNAFESLLQPVSCGEDLAKHQNAFVPGHPRVDVPRIQKLDQILSRAGRLDQRGKGGMGKSVILAQCVARYSTGPEHNVMDSKDSEADKNTQQSLLQTLRNILVLCWCLRASSCELPLCQNLLEPIATVSDLVADRLMNAAQQY